MCRKYTIIESIDTYILYEPLYIKLGIYDAIKLNVISYIKLYKRKVNILNLLEHHNIGVNQDIGLKKII